MKWNLHMNHNTKSKQIGFSLIEFMISMMLGLILILGISNYFLSSRQVSQTNDTLNKFSDYSKYISSRLNQEIRMVDYEGMLKNPPSNLLKNNTELKYNFSIGLKGFDNVDPTNLPSEILNYLDLTPVKDSDVLLMHTSYDVTPVPVQSSTTDDDVTVSSINDASRGCSADSPYSGLCAGDIALISDFTKSKIFQITSISSSGVITHTASGAPGNNVATWSDSELQFDSDAEIMPLRTITYYIATVNHVTGLYKKENNNASQLVIPYVVNLQIEYGVDTDGDKSVDDYKKASNVVDWSSVLSVRVALLLASENDHVVNQHQSDVSEPNFIDGSTTATDYRIYRPLIFTTTIRNRVQ